MSMSNNQDLIEERGNVDVWIDCLEPGAHPATTGMLQSWLAQSTGGYWKEHDDGLSNSCRLVE